MSDDSDGRTLFEIALDHVANSSEVELADEYLRIATLETQLAEERAKRDAAEKSRDDWRNQWSGLLMHEDAAKRLSESNKLRADTAEHELADVQAKLDLSLRNEVVGHRSHRAIEQVLRERAEKAEGRVAELEAELDARVGRARILFPHYEGDSAEKGPAKQGGA